MTPAASTSASTLSNRKHSRPIECKREPLVGPEDGVCSGPITASIKKQGCIAFGATPRLQCDHAMQAVGLSHQVHGELPTNCGSFKTGALLQRGSCMAAHSVWK